MIMNEQTYDFSGTVAVVTGAGSGIGRAVAIGFASSCTKVALVDIDEDKARATQEMITKKGGASIVVEADLSKLPAIQRMVDKVLRQFGQIDILANVAAIYPPSSVTTITEEHWDSVMALNLKGVFFTCQAVLKHMMEQKKGVIINIGSGAAYYPIRFMTTYAASKGGIVAMSRNLALEAASSGVRVNVVVPGPTDTEGSQATRATIEDHGLGGAPRATLLGRKLSPEEIAEAVIWVSSDRARGLIGATVFVNGGCNMP